MTATGPLHAPDVAEAAAPVPRDQRGRGVGGIEGKFRAAGSASPPFRRGDESAADALALVIRVNGKLVQHPHPRLAVPVRVRRAPYTTTS